MNPWIVLGIAETDDKNALRQAYMATVAHHNPEEDPEGFQTVRLAYETALKQIEDGQKEDTTPIGMFLAKAGKLYKNFARRIDVEQWRELLADPICTSFEFEDELSLRLLDFLMRHHYLPRAVWQLLDSKFNWVAQADELSKDIHPGFLSFITNSIEQESNLKLELFDATQERDFDRFINLGGQLNDVLDDRDLEKATPLMEELEALDIAHPNYSFVRAHYLALVGKAQEALELLDSTLAVYAQDYQASATPDFVRAIILSTFIEDKDKLAQARDIFLDLSERFAPYYFAQLGYLETLGNLGQWEEGFEYIRQEMICLYPSGIYLMSLYGSFGVQLCEKYQALYDQDPTDEAVALTLAKHYLYTGSSQQGYDILVGIEHIRNAEFHDLMGIALVDIKKDPERAEEHLLKAVALEPTYRFYGSLVFCYEQFEQYDKIVALMPQIETLPPPEKIDTYTKANILVSYAIGLKKAGKLDEAAEVLARVEQLSPNLSRVFLEQARLFFKTGDLPKAVSYAEQALSLSSQASVSAFEVLLDVFESIRNVEEMEKILERVDSLQHQSHGITVFRASALIFKEQDEEAAKLLEELIAQDNLGDDWAKKAYNYLATCYQYLGKTEEVVKLWQAYSELYPADASGYNRKAMALFDQKRLGEALETVDKGLQGVQTDVCRYNLKLRKAIILQRQKENRKALEELVSVIDNWCEGIWFQKDVMCGKLSDLYDTLGQPEPALKYATLGIEANPEHVDCLYTLGLIKSYYSKDYTAAIGHFTKLLEVDQEKYSVYYERGRAYAELGETALAHADFRQTIALANQAIADDQADGQVPYHGMYRYLALAHLALGDVATAKDMLETADKQQLSDGTGPNNCFCVYQTYGVLYASQGDYEQALTYLERAGELRSAVKNDVLKAQVLEELAKG